jgi:hypothetical protein
MDLEPGMREAQERFARVLDLGTRLALVLLVAGFALYVSGLLPPQVPLAELPSLWRLPLREYLAASGAPTGWGWLALSGRGDYLNYYAVGLLCSIVLLGFLRALPVLPRRYAAIAALQVVVLLAAASGLLR